MRRVRLLPSIGVRLAACLVMLSLSTTADARPTDPPPPRHKSEMVAIGATLGGMVAAGALAIGMFDEGGKGSAVDYALIGGVLALPSLGHVYAEDWWWTGIGIGTRLGAVGLLAVGNNIERTPANCVPDSEFCDRTSTARFLLRTGDVLLVASLLVELFHAPYSAHKFNQRHAITITPTPLAGGGGVALGGQF